MCIYSASSFGSNFTNSEISDAMECCSVSLMTSSENVKQPKQFLNVFYFPLNDSNPHDRVLLLKFLDKFEDQDEHPQVLERENTGKGRKRTMTGMGKACGKCDESKEHSDDEIVGNNDRKAKEDEYRLFVHSTWLSEQSSYFKSLFYYGMKASCSKEVVMKISQNELQGHLTLIEAMYKVDILDSKDYQLVAQVLVLADKYDVQLVFKKCKYVLMDTLMTLESCEFILKNIAGVPNCDDLDQCMQKCLVKEFSPLDKTWNDDKFVELSEAALELLLSSDHLPVRSENTVFVALMRWIENKSNSNTEQFSSLLNLARCELMTVDFLYDVVRLHSVAKNMPGFNEYLQKGLAYRGFKKKRRVNIENKPIRRPSVDNEDPTFVWLVDKKAIEYLFAPSGSSAGPTSEYFWYFGYRMQMAMEYESESKSLIIALFVDLPEDGQLHLQWKADSYLFETIITIPCCAYVAEKGWGKEVKCTISPQSVSGDVSYTIDIYICI